MQHFDQSILVQRCVSVIMVVPTVSEFTHHLHILLRDSYWFMFCQFFSHIQYNQSSNSCRIIPVKLHQGLLEFCASSHTNMCLAAWVAIRKHAVGVGRGWESISFFTAELPWRTPSSVPCPSLASSPTLPKLHSPCLLFCISRVFSQAALLNKRVSI